MKQNTSTTLYAAVFNLLSSTVTINKDFNSDGQRIPYVSWPVSSKLSTRSLFATNLGLFLSPHPQHLWAMTRPPRSHHEPLDHICLPLLAWLAGWHTGDTHFHRNEYSCLPLLCLCIRFFFSVLGFVRHWILLEKNTGPLSLAKVDLFMGKTARGWLSLPFTLSVAPLPVPSAPIYLPHSSTVLLRLLFSWTRAGLVLHYIYDLWCWITSLKTILERHS